MFLFGCVCIVYVCLYFSNTNLSYDLFFPLLYKLYFGFGKYKNVLFLFNNKTQPYCK